jgi:hypothetical protein
MSEASIAKSNGNLKPTALDLFFKLAERSIDAPIPFELVDNPGPVATPTPSDTEPKPPRRRGPRKSGLHLMLQSAREHGITHPTIGGFLQLPREFDAILALEQKATVQVFLEVLRQTIGTPDYDRHGNAQRREWAEISTRDFVHAGLTTQKAAWRGIKDALAKGYIVRREVGAQRFEYAIRWRGTN